MKKRMQHMAGQFRMVLLTIVVFFLIVLCAFMVMGCSSDEADDVLANYKYVICEAVTGADKHIATLRYDDGSEWSVTNVAEAATADTIYRVEAAVIEDIDGRHVTLGGLSPVVSPFPFVHGSQPVRRDPVEVVTMWRSPRYVNMRIAIARGGGPHGIGFCDDGIVHYPDGRKTRCFSLYHDKNGDPENYSSEYILSCPVYQCADQLAAGRDSVRFVVRTHSDRPYIFTTVY